MPFKGAKADVFSLGVLLFSLAFGSAPFNWANKYEDKLFSFLVNKPKDFFRLHPSTKIGYRAGSVNFDLQDLLLNMLSSN